MTIYEIVNEVLQLLDQQEIDYLLVGAIATGAWAIPRSTTDLDFGYIQSWCEQHGTLARLEESRKAIPEI